MSLNFHWIQKYKPSKLNDWKKVHFTSKMDVFLFNNTLLISIAIRRYKWPSDKTLLQYGKQVVFNQLILLFWSFSYPLSPIQEKWYILWKKWYLPTFNFWIVTKPFQMSRVLIFVTQNTIARLRYLSSYLKV